MITQRVGFPLLQSFTRQMSLSQLCPDVISSVHQSGIYLKKDYPSWLSYGLYLNHTIELW